MPGKTQKAPKKQLKKIQSNEWHPRKSVSFSQHMDSLLPFTSDGTEWHLGKIHERLLPIERKLSVNFETLRHSFEQSKEVDGPLRSTCKHNLYIYLIVLDACTMNMLVPDSSDLEQSQHAVNNSFAMTDQEFRLAHEQDVNNSKAQKQVCHMIFL